MREAEIYYKDRLAGILIEDEQGYSFQYLSDYLDDPEARAISLTIPLHRDRYTSPVLFPFFDGLIPEGWLLDIAVANWKLDQRDRMAILLKTCRDCIGAVSVVDITGGDNE